jgi:hypothetical protein
MCTNLSKKIWVNLTSTGEKLGQVKQMELTPGPPCGQCLSVALTVCLSVCVWVAKITKPQPYGPGNPMLAKPQPYGLGKPMLAKPQY